MPLRDLFQFWLGNIGPLQVDLDNTLPDHTTPQLPGVRIPDGLRSLRDSLRHADTADISVTQDDMNFRVDTVTTATMSNPVQLNSMRGIDPGDIAIVRDSVGGSEMTIYVWTDAGLVANPPFIVTGAAPANSYWVAVAGFANAGPTYLQSLWVDYILVHYLLKLTYGADLEAYDTNETTNLRWKYEGSTGDHQLYDTLGNTRAEWNSATGRLRMWDAAANLQIDINPGTALYVYRSGNLGTYISGEMWPWAILNAGTRYFEIRNNTASVKFSVAGATGNTRVYGALQTDGENLGTKHSYGYSHDVGGAIAALGLLVLKAGELTGPTYSFCGWVPPRAGSITGAAVRYDITAGHASGATMQIHVNGAVVWSIAISATAASNKIAYSTQARNTDTFSAGDILAISILNNSATTPMSINDVAATLEVFYDA